MASIKTLQELLSQDAVSNGDIRYILDSTKSDLEIMTLNCAGSLREKFYWAMNKLQNYPNCIVCNTSLTSSNFKTNYPGGQYTSHCSVKCAKRNIINIEKTRKTIENKYNASSYLASIDARIKIESTNKLKYGTKIPAPFGSERFKNNMKIKYGVESPRHMPQVNNKIVRHQILTNIDTGKTEASINACQSKRNVICLSKNEALDENRNTLDQVELKWKHISCGKEYSAPIINGNITVCPHCKSGSSVLELSLRGMILDIYTGDIQFNCRNILPSKKELDIYIPELKIAFEFNGIYWHSTIVNEDRTYHLAKTEECEKLGIKLIHVWEHDFLQQTDLIRGMIVNALGKSIRLNARDCMIKNIKSSESTDFLSIHHIDGAIKAKLHLGLFTKDGKLISVMTFGKKRFDRQQTDSWEIYRFASHNGYQIRGGASKLFKYFINQNQDINRVISFCDRSLGGGSVYLHIGMSELKPTPPSYFWANTTVCTHLSRFMTQKHKLKNLIGDMFDENLSEAENMKRLGWFKLWDCGNRSFEWER